MNTTTINHFNTRIPSSAMFDLARPDRTPTDACPVFVFEGSVCAFPVLNGDDTPILLTHDDIVELGGTVPEGGDILVGAVGRKVWLGQRCWQITAGWEFTEC